MMVIQMSVSKMSLLPACAQWIKHRLTLTRATHIVVGFCIQIVTQKSKQTKHSHAEFLGKENQHLPERERLSLKEDSFFFFLFPFFPFFFFQ